MPSHLLQQLVVDHHNFETLAEVLARQASRLEAGESGDLEVIELGLAYLQRYGDQCHHPREELIYERLRRLDPDTASRAAAVTREHEWLHGSTQLLLREVRRGLDGELIDTDELARGLLELIAAQREHVYDEGRTLFALARERLDARDWAEIEKEAALLSGAERALRIHERFAALRDYIHRIDRFDPP